METMKNLELKEIIQNLKFELKEIRIDIGERPKHPFTKNSINYKFKSQELKDNFNEIIEYCIEHVSKQGDIYEFIMCRDNEDFIQDKWTLLFNFTMKNLELSMK